MTDSFIYVKPSQAQDRVKVKTEKIGDVDVPAYVQTDGAGTLISDENPLPVKASSDDPVSTENLILTGYIEALNSHIVNLLIEQRLTNLYLSKMVGEDLRIDNELENR